MTDPRQPPKHSLDLLDLPGKKSAIANLLADPQKTTPPAPAAAPSAPAGPPKTFKVDANNDLLSRLQAFLPQMEAANAQLDAQDKTKLDIENLEDSDGPYIEMNLGLGVYGLKPPGADEDGSDTDSDNEIVIPSASSGKQGKPTAKPTIEMLDNQDTE
ncbi:hypothetical protein BC940DRAFT_292458 [Gongronella butleri]|nr:hypothetical protein BC940DRAFT_292458 [Gongronella butleri]